MKPFVKWAGGKTRLLYEIERRLPSDFNEWKNVAYVEPFVGGGAVLCHMLNTHNNITKVVINDINKILIGTYRCIQVDPRPLITELAKLEVEYNTLDESNRSERYYELRNLFNSITTLSIHKIALFLFLNQTCFNGLYRENTMGEFNVPHGRYPTRPLYNESNIWKMHKALQNVEILQGSFEHVGRKLRRQHVFFYLDPPYRPLTEDSHMFTMYNRNGFNDTHQVLLKQMCDYIHSRGWHFMLSNSDSKTANNESYFELLYNDYIVDHIKVTRFINTYNAKSSKQAEVIITNYQHHNLFNI